MKQGGRLVRSIAITALLMLAWTALVVALPLLGFGRLKTDGTGSRAFTAAARAHAAEHRGNLALVLVERRQIAETHAMSIGKRVTPDTLFQAASVSKWVAAWGVMTLVEAGKLDLDTPVSRYLKRWKLPVGDHSNDRVTVRRLLSHTAGLNDDLGYCGFAPGAPVQPIEASLTLAADACPLRTGAVRVGGDAGDWRYSGGGYTLLQLLVEEVSGEPFADYMARAVLAPLGMTRSTYRVGAEGATDVATFYDSDGLVAPHNRYTAAAAASLYTSANDLARFAQAHFKGAGGAPIGRGVLSPTTVRAMGKPYATLLGTPHWGLGMQIYASSKSGGFLIGHDGGNVPAINTTVRLDPLTGDAIVALSTGGNGIASRLGSEWTAQRRSAIMPAMIYGSVQRQIRWIAGGMLILSILAFVGYRRGSPARRLHVRQ